MSFMLCGLPISNMTFRFVMQSQVPSEISILKADSSKFQRFQRFQKFPGPWEQEMQFLVLLCHTLSLAQSLCHSSESVGSRVANLFVVLICSGILMLSPAVLPAAREAEAHIASQGNL